MAWDKDKPAITTTGQNSHPEILANWAAIEAVLGSLAAATPTNFLKVPASGSTVFNEGGADIDFRIEGVGAPNAFFVQGSDGKVGIGTPTIPHGGVGAAILALEGPNSSVNGPHTQITTAQDDYPAMAFWIWQHDNMCIKFDCYHDAGGEKSSDVGSNFQIGKEYDIFIIQYDSGIAQGAAITWNDGIVLDTTGLVTIQAAKLAVGVTTPSAAQWGALGALVEWTNWTPTLTGGANLSGYNSARYYRIGNICFFHFVALNQNVTTAGTIQVTLPFTVANTQSIPPTAQVNDGAAWIGQPHVVVTVNTNYFIMDKTAAHTGWAGTETGVYIFVSGFFEIA